MIITTLLLQHHTTPDLSRKNAEHIQSLDSVSSQTRKTKPDTGPREPKNHSCIWVVALQNDLGVLSGLIDQGNRRLIEPLGDNKRGILLLRVAGNDCGAVELSRQEYIYINAM